MKKIISVMLSALMIFSLLSVGVSAADNKDLKVTVANDLHYNLDRAVYDGQKFKVKDYSHVPGNGQLWVEANIIVDTFFAEFLQSSNKILLIPGDLVDHGIDSEHRAFALKLKTLEEKGKRVYVVPGNHDYYGGATPEKFAEYYADFGYSEAIAKDANSASYVVNLNSEYRLLAIDSCLPGDGVSGIDEDRKAWIEEQAQKAQKDGKKLISMMHHNLLDHFVLSSTIHPGAFVDSDLGLPELYAQYNIKYNLTGHTHAHDIMSYTGTNGVTIYDVLTSSLNLYPLPYRNITFGETADIISEYIESVNMTSKKDIISDNCYALASKDFQAYALECAEYGLNSVIKSYTSPEYVKLLLNLDDEDHASLCELIDKILPRFAQLLDAPMYMADSKGGESLEAYARQISLDFTKTDLHSFKELAVFLYQQYVEGDENFGLFSAEYNLLTASLTVILNQVLAEISAEDYAGLLDYLAAYFNLKLDSLESFTAYAGDTISRTKGIDVFVSALGSAVILHFTTDDEPKDINAILPGYESPAVAEEDLSLWDRIVNFFRSAFNYIRRIFSIGM